VIEMSKELEVGDRVKIADDSPLARRVLDVCGFPSSGARTKHLGLTGKISEYSGYKLYYVTIGNSPDGWWWPSVLLTKLPDEKTWIEMMDAVAYVESPKCVPLKCRCVFDPAPIPRDTSPAEIVFDHVVVDGKCKLVIADISGVSRCDELLDAYYGGRPVMDSPSPGVLWTRFEDDEIRRYYVGQLLTEDEAAKLVKRMKACGERLHKINAAARAEKDAAIFEAWKAKGRKVVRI